MSDDKYKVILIGESGVGKEEIIINYSKNDKFPPNSNIEPPKDFVRVTADLPNGKSVTFDVWDTFGKKEYRSLSKIYIEDADAVILVYDITNENSFKELKEFWYEEVKRVGKKDFIFAVAANRSELYEQMKVSHETGKEWASSIGAGFFPISNKNGTGLKKICEYLGNKILDPNFNQIEEEEREKKERYEQYKKAKLMNQLGCKIGNADSYVFDVTADIRLSNVRGMHMMIYHVVEDFQTRVFSYEIPSSVWCNGMAESILKLNNMRIEHESNREAFLKIKTYISKVEEIDKLMDKLYYDIDCDSDYYESLDDQKVEQICSFLRYLMALGK